MGSLVAEDLDRTPSDYEKAYLDAIRESAARREFWRDAEGIEFEDLCLEGSYPETRLAAIFRAVPSSRTRFGAPQSDCRFGVRKRIWPAEYADPREEAYFFGVYFTEFIGTSSRAYNPVRGVVPCDPERINWLDWGM